jgi:hypothetical protein
VSEMSQKDPAASLPIRTRQLVNKRVNEGMLHRRGNREERGHGRTCHTVTTPKLFHFKLRSEPPLRHVFTLELYLSEVLI